MALTKTRSLMADFATAMQIPGVPQDDSGAFALVVGEDTDVLMYGEDDESLLVVAPIGPLPPEPGAGLTIYLLRQNMFNSDITPFQVSLDDSGGVILWGRLQIEDFTGETLAGLVGALAEKVADLKAEVVGDDEGDEDEAETAAA